MDAARQKETEARREARAKIKPRHEIKNCSWCGESFEAKSKTQKYCSSDCCYQGKLRDRREQWREEYVPKKLICKECGSEFVTECGSPRSVFCCQSCADRNERRAEHATERHKAFQKNMEKRRKAQILRNFVEAVSYEEIYERDHGICQICGLPVHPTKRIDNNWDGTIDHIIPLASDGKHSYENCQLAHRICNSLKLQETGRFTIDWEEKSKENNHWRLKYERYHQLMSA